VTFVLVTVLFKRYPV